MTMTAGLSIPSDGVPIHYEVHGSGPAALVFVHGWCCNRGYWAEQIEHFAPDHTVVTIDLAGHGESGRGRAEWTMQAFGQDVAAVVRQLGLRRVVLIGHSMGGPVIVEAAALIPENVVGLVGADTWRSLSLTRTPEQAYEGLADLRADFLLSAQARVRGMFIPSSSRALSVWPGLV
jgi:pimeloyl-ACP methyl ester carboxylesterase